MRQFYLQWENPQTLSADSAAGISGIPGFRLRCMRRSRDHGSQNAMWRVNTIGEAGRARLKDIGRRYLVHMMVANGLDLVPAFTRADRLFFDLHTAPGGDDDVGIALDDLFGLDDAVLGLASLAELRKDWLAAGDLDEFLDPLDATDDWIVPLFEEDARPARKAGRASSSKSGTIQSSVASSGSRNSSRSPAASQSFRSSARLARPRTASSNPNRSSSAIPTSSSPPGAV